MFIQGRMNSLLIKGGVLMLWFLLIGLIAGGLAGQLMQGGGYGLIGNVVIGVIGSYVGGFLFRQLGISSSGTIGSIIVATVGAIVFLAIWNFLF